jgi:hypothetical protein
LFIRKKRRVNRLKKSYIFFISLLKKILAKFGFFKDRKGNKHNSVVFRWVESIFAIYDQIINIKTISMNQNNKINYFERKTLLI